MRDLDGTDMAILQLLLADARRPYSDIAEEVGLSSPAVSDRIARLRETGVIERFTVDIDRSQLRDGIPLLVQLELETAPGGSSVETVEDRLLSAGAVEHVFTAADGRLVFSARLSETDVASWVADVVGDDVDVADLEVILLSRVAWSPGLDGAAFGLSCAQCGNTVDDEGSAARIEGDLYHFCCPSCEARFRERIEELREGAA